MPSSAIVVSQPVQTRVIPANITTPMAATRTEQAGVAVDSTVIAVITLTDDGAGAFIDGAGSVDYNTAQISVKVLGTGRTAYSYKSDYEDSAEFASVSDGNGSSGSAARRGGSYATAVVSEDLVDGSAVIARYRPGPPAQRNITRSFVPPAVSLDLCPYTTHRIVAGSVRFRWMGTVYDDFEGVLYRGRTDANPGIESGRMDYASGTALMTDYVVGGSGSTDFQLLSLWTQNSPWSTACLFFSSEAAPLRAGPGGFVLTVVDTRGNTLTAHVDAQGNITGNHMNGRIEFQRGGVELQFGDFVSDADLSAADKAEWWYSPADVGAVQAGKVWRPWPVDPTTLRYSCVSYIYLPVDVSLMGIDPAALPPDGRVAYARPGDTCVVGVTYGGSPFAPAVGMTYNVGHQRLSMVQVLGPDGAELRDGYSADLDAGTVLFTDMAGYPATVSVVARTEVYRQIAEVRIDGSVKLTQPVGYAFDAGAVFSTALRQGDRFARVKRTYNQNSWNGSAWVDGLDGNASTARYDAINHPIEVSNRGAITERWALRLRSDGSTFDLIGQHLGQIASGSINADFSPLNAARGAPYMTVRAAGWGAGWVAGNTVFIDTVGAEFPIDVVRCTQPGSPAGIDDSCWIVQRGDVDRPPP